MNEMDFACKRVVITGAASGIGRALAKELAARGAQLLVSDIDPAGLQDCLGELGSGARAQLCDIADYAAVEQLAARAAEWFGGCDLVFANAGVIAGGRFTKMAPADVDWFNGFGRLVGRAGNAG